VARDLRLLAAQGALPLITADLVELVHLLLGDPDEAVRIAASASLGALPLEELRRSRGTAARRRAILGYVLARRGDQGLREAVLQNSSTPTRRSRRRRPRFRRTSRSSS